MAEVARALFAVDVAFRAFLNASVVVGGGLRSGLARVVSRRGVWVVVVFIVFPIGGAPLS